MADPNPSPASPPSEPFGVPKVGVEALCRALGTSRTSLYRAIEAGRIPDTSDRSGPNHGRRWPVAVAAGLVTAAGRPVPQAWQPHAAAGGAS